MVCDGDAADRVVPRLPADAMGNIAFGLPEINPLRRGAPWTEQPLEIRVVSLYPGPGARRGENRIPRKIPSGKPQPESGEP